MSKQKVNILIGLMAVALTGIVVLQVVWINNAMELRNELFDRSVKGAMIETSKKLETMSDVFWLRDMVGQEGMPPPFLHHPAPPRFRSHREKGLSDSLAFEFKSKLPHRNIAGSNVWVTAAGKPDSLPENIRVEFMNVDSAISTLEKKIDHNIMLMYNHSVNKLQNDSTFDIRKGELARRFVARSERLKNVAGKMVYESWNMEQPRKPDTAGITHVLTDELLKRDIPIPFQLGVFYADTNLIKTAGSDSLKLVNTHYQAQLYPGNIFERDEHLSIYFPGRKVFLFKKMIGPALLSLLFSTFVMIIFGMSIFYIVKQKKISEMKSDFMNNMTHEFKTPIATISVAADSILNPKVIANEEQIKHFTGIIKKENHRMNQQVETILQIARLDKKDFEFNFKAVDIHDLIDKAVHGFQLQVESRGGKINVKKEAMNPVVITDATHTLNLLNNLLDNANKYSPAEPEIEVKTYNSDRGVWILVSDKGIGMNKQVQLKIFEKFYRESSGNIHNVKGFGLGLSYVKAVVDANKGEVKVVSEPGKGSTFEVFIPFSIIT